jgi:hypothetical protein
LYVHIIIRDSTTLWDGEVFIHDVINAFDNTGH